MSDWWRTTARIKQEEQDAELQKLKELYSQAGIHAATTIKQGMVNNTMATSNNTGPYLSGAMNVGTAMANKPVRELVRVSYDELTMQRTVSVMAEGGGGMRLTAHGVVELYNQDGEKYLTMGPNGFTDGTTTIDIGDAAARFATWAMVSCGGN